MFLVVIRNNWPGETHKADSNSFLFSFINKKNKKLIMKHTDPTFAIFTSKICGPSFGSGCDQYVCDLIICSKSNTIHSSYSNGNTYTDINSNETKSFLAGSYKFLTTEI